MPIRTERLALIHRHITTTDWTPMAIESLFDRGDLKDWREFAAALRRDTSLADWVLAVCGTREADGAEEIARTLIELFHPRKGPRRDWQAA